MLGAWKWYFCLWIRDLVAVVLGWVVPVWVGSLAFRLGTGLMSSAIMARRVTQTNSARS